MEDYINALTLRLQPGKVVGPYSVPEVAQRLVDCLNANDEETAKTIFVWELI